PKGLALKFPSSYTIKVPWRVNTAACCPYCHANEPFGISRYFCHAGPQFSAGPRIQTSCPVAREILITAFWFRSDTISLFPFGSSLTEFACCESQTSGPGTVK